MNHLELLRLVEAYEAAEQELREGGRSVWHALVISEPELAGAILQLFANEDAAAAWVVSPLRELGCSPAKRAAEGHAAEVMPIVLRTTHGVYG